MPGHSHFGGHSGYCGKLPRFPFQDPCIHSLSCHKCWPLMAHNCIFSENGFGQRELPCPKFQPSSVNVGVNRWKRLVLRSGTLSYLGQPSSRDSPIWLSKDFVTTAMFHIASLISLQVLFLSKLLNKSPASKSLSLRVCFYGTHLKQWPCPNTLLIIILLVFFLNESG